VFALLELIGEVFGLLDATATLTRREGRTFFASLLLFGALLLVVATRTPRALGRDDVLWVSGFVAAELAAALVVITLLHAIRPVGEDLPARSWSQTYARCAGPLALAVFGALLVLPRFDGTEGWPLSVTIAGAAVSLLGVAAAIRQARAAF
jgi:hypothetical protein